MGVATLSNGRNKATNSEGGERNDAPDSSKPVAVVPFVRASDEHLQPGNIDFTSGVLGATAQDMGIKDLPAYGYIRWLYLRVKATAGVAGLNNAVGHADAPWNVLQNIALTEPNGAYIVQFTDGYQMLLANKYGGYLPPVSSDPRKSPVFSAIAVTGNFTFVLRVPVSVSDRDGLGALANQDSAGQFKFRCTIAASATVFTTGPDTKPVVNVRAWLAAYDQPEAQSAGMGNQTEPPAHGTTSFWTVQSGLTVNAGENTLELKRKGNYIRQIIFVLRRAGTSRANGELDWPTELRFLRDAFPARYYDTDIWKHQMFERTGYTGTADTAGAPENGVRYHSYMQEFDGALGRENRDQWQPTRGSTRLEIAGSFLTAGTMDVITNDVAIADNVFL